MGGTTDPADKRATTAPTLLSTHVAPDEAGAGIDADDTFLARYEVRAKLGEGGMGEVHLCDDRRIGREIAMKVIRAARSSRRDVRRRFVREARVQGQLEHPSIVPVYDLGKDPTGAAYFTMRRVRGLTLEEVLDELRAGDVAMRQRWTRHKLLTAFGSVCLAVDFAHKRGVIHRDLKPDNVMLGDFGEVYVLDWGLAKVVDTAADSERAVTPEAPLEEEHARRAGPARTAHGSIMGTPGYMAPEQITGDVDSLDPRTDVYSLGALLFELLTLTRLHPKGTPKELMEATMRGCEARPSLRTPERDVAPELEAICVRATELAPRDRYPTARDLYEAVERFLDGDRDVVLRKGLAREHARAAAEAAARAIAGGGGTAATEERKRALREVSRAIALDPGDPEAMRTLVRLLTEAPEALPPEAQAELDAAHEHSQRVSAKATGWGYLSWLLYAPFVVWMGLKNGGWGVLCDVLFVCSAVAAFSAARARHPARGALDATMIVSTVAIVCSTGLFGPFVLLPGLAAVNTIAFVVAVERSRRLVAVALGCLAVLTPFVLEAMGALPPQTAFKDGAFVVLPQIADLPRLPTIVFLVLANLAIIITSSAIVARFRDSLATIERRLYFQTWQLRQFLPRNAHASVAPPPP